MAATDVKEGKGRMGYNYFHALFLFLILTDNSTEKRAFWKKLLQKFNTPEMHFFYIYTQININNKI